MTITAVRPGPAAVVAAAGPSAAPCPADRHGDSQHAWRYFGCRHPGAVAAHLRYLANDNRIRRERETSRAAAGCAARSHRATRESYRHGCRCPDTVAVFFSVQPRVARAEAARLVKPWRGPKMRVDPVNLSLLLSGYRDRPTQAENMVAVLRLTTAGLSAPAISDRLSLNVRTVVKYRALLRELREQRTARRLAESRARALLVAIVAERRATLGQ